MNRANTALTAEKIALKVRELQARLDNEQRLKAGFERLVQQYDSAVNIGGGSSGASSGAGGGAALMKEHAADKSRDCQQRIGLLKTALQRYQGMHVEGLANCKCYVYLCGVD